MNIKKLIASTALLTLLSSNVVSAAIFTAAFNSNFEKNDGIEVLSTHTIVAGADDEITAANDIVIIIPNGLQAIFNTDTTSLVFGGSAFEKVSREPSYSFNAKQMTLDVQEDFVFDDTLEIIGIALRVDGGSHSKQFMQLDFTGDGVADTDNTAGITISSTSVKNDTLAPQAVRNVRIDILDDQNYVSWDLPPNLDLVRVRLTRGDLDEQIDMMLNTSFQDTDKHEKYTFVVTDGPNDSIAVTANTSDFVVVVEEPVVEEEVVVVEEEVIVVEEEVVVVVEEEPLVEEPVVEEEDVDIELIEFTDTAGHWAEMTIGIQAEKGIVQGNPDGSFSPDASLNRAAAAALIFRVVTGNTDTLHPNETPFPDVSADEWFAGYVVELYNMGLVAGNPDGTFAPGKNINRAEFLTMAINAYKHTSDEVAKDELAALIAGAKTEAYQDLADDWYTANVTAATALEFVSGKDCDGGKCFNATAQITRAEATVMLWNMNF
ncbi:S-layer homology domain-containing protein [Candidatus Gracilibacteria bacterium]|nr:S-layer homology domain-containing protein [Candidatus Gracilibacteria bacterium]